MMQVQDSENPMTDSVKIGGSVEDEEEWRLKKMLLEDINLIFEKK